MKKGLIFLTLVLFLKLQAVEVNAQGFLALKVTDMPGYPTLPQDTAYEGFPYDFNITVVNGTNTFINVPVTINLRVDSNFATIPTNPIGSIPPNDSIIVSVQGYLFTPSTYKAGNNIVVVWPSVSGMFIPIDSTFKNVFFVPLSSLGNEEPKGIDFQLFPIPATDYLYLGMAPEQQVEYVRIFNVSGQLVTSFAPGQNRRIDVSYLRSGLYFIEIRTPHSIGCRRFVKI